MDSVNRKNHRLWRKKYWLIAAAILLVTATILKPFMIDSSFRVKWEKLVGSELPRGVDIIHFQEQHWIDGDYTRVWCLMNGNEKDVMILSGMLKLYEVPAILDAELHPPKNVASWWYSPNNGSVRLKIFHGGELPNSDKIILRYYDGRMWLFFQSKGPL